MVGPRGTNGSGGPFNGREVRCAVERLGWRAIEEPADDEFVGFLCAGNPERIWLDLDKDNIYYGDPYFKAIARIMTRSAVAGVAGALRRRVVQDQMLQLRSAVMTCREHREMRMDEFGEGSYG